MRQNGISVVRTRKYKATTDSNHKFNIAPNLLDRDFNADAPNQKLARDVSYIWTREAWLNLGATLDLHSRRVIGWAVRNRMKSNLAIRALGMAIAFRQPPKGCIHHTDRGSQYCSHDCRKTLRQHGFKASMSGKWPKLALGTARNRDRCNQNRESWRHARNMSIVGAPETGKSACHHSSNSLIIHLSALGRPSHQPASRSACCHQPRTLSGEQRAREVQQVRPG